jgi:hypothetical protein
MFFHYLSSPHVAEKKKDTIFSLLMHPKKNSNDKSPFTCEHAQEKTHMSRPTDSDRLTNISKVHVFSVFNTSSHFSIRESHVGTKSSQSRNYVCDVASLAHPHSQNQPCEIFSPLIPFPNTSRTLGNPGATSAPEILGGLDLNPAKE